MCAVASIPRAVVDWLRQYASADAHLRVDSRAVVAGDVFVALRGRNIDGRRYIEQAFAQGAVAALVDETPDAALAGATALEGICGSPAEDRRLPVAGLAGMIGAIAAEFYGHPGDRLLMVGVTGTNGKTSSCQWIADGLERAGRRCGLIGTLGCGFPGDLHTDGPQLTTPDAASLQRTLRDLLAGGARAVAMEVSSIGIDQRRIDATPFDIGLFTNLTRDHLDYHGDMESYAAAKRRFLHWPTLSHVVLNLDDEFGRRTAAELVRRGSRVTGFGTREEHVAMHGMAASLWAEDITHHASGLRFRIRYRRTERGTAADVEDVVVTAALVGDFNVANLLGVAGVLLACELPLAAVAEALRGLRPPPGRMQFVEAGDGASPGDGAPLVVVDYAHTPDAIAKALQALRPLAEVRSGQLRIVFGAGGDRDRGKRPLMGAAASRGADAIVLTSDNPRGEDPGRILDEIAAGVAPGTPLWRDVDRAAAIDAAIRAAQPCDVVLIAGKGHEDYQEIGGRRLPFSDLETAGAALAARGSSAERSR